MPSGQCFLEPIQVAARIDNAVVIYAKLVCRANGGQAIYSDSWGRCRVDVEDLLLTVRWSEASLVIILGCENDVISISPCK